MFFFFFVSLIFAFLSFPLQSQENFHDPDELNLPDSGEFFVHQKNHVPGQPINTSVKTISLAFNIWQRDDGTGNFPENDFIMGRMERMVHWLNHIFSSVDPPVKPVEGVDYLEDSHIRFVLKTVKFHQNSSLFEVGCGFGSRLNNYIFENYPYQRQYLNIHFNTGECIGARGYANYPSSIDLESDSFIVTFIKDGYDSESYNFWTLMLHLAHELGHNLDLRHPYNSEYCSFSHPDFLFDLFGFERQEWCENPRGNCDICFHDGGWACDFDDPEKTCTNNLMGGNRNPGSITPLQMGRMNRSLTMRSVRKYAWGYGEDPFIVENDQLWSFNKKFFQDIIIDKGVTLVVNGTLEMVPEAKIIVRPGGRLIIDNGLITNALYSNDFWQGIVTEVRRVPWLLRWLINSKEGELILTGSGRVENHLLY